jgi:secondary thiamine-phosphate synthase enzyme
MKSCSFTLNITSQTAPEFIDITSQIQEYVHQSGIKNGILTVFSRHTTAAIVIQENEPLLLEDFRNFLNCIAPEEADYRHNDFNIRTVHMHEDECPNGHSHCRQLLLGASESVPLIESEMSLGEWQRIFFVELDEDKAGVIDGRQVVVQVLGQS